MFVAENSYIHASVHKYIHESTEKTMYLQKYKFDCALNEYMNFEFAVPIIKIKSVFKVELRAEKIFFLETMQVYNRIPDYPFQMMMFFVKMDFYVFGFENIFEKK